MKCSGDSVILHEKWKKNELIRVVSRTISCIISESPLHFIPFLTVWSILPVRLTFSIGILPWRNAVTVSLLILTKIAYTGTFKEQCYEIIQIRWCIILTYFPFKTFRFVFFTIIWLLGKRVCNPHRLNAQVGFDNTRSAQLMFSMTPRVPQITCKAIHVTNPSLDTRTVHLKHIRVRFNHR